MLPQAMLPKGDLTMTLAAKLSTDDLDVFPSILPDGLLGQAILLSLNDGMHVRATFVPIPIQHNMDFQGCSQRSQFSAIDCHCYANHIDFPSCHQ